MDTQFDVIVAGGGLAGTMAAIAAAQGGARTLLIERYAALGGMATLGLVQPITVWGLNDRFVGGGRAKKLLEELAAQPRAATPVDHYGPTCDAEHLKLHLERRCLDAGVTLLYHTWIHRTLNRNERIESLVGLSKGGEAEFKAAIFIDATGDCDLAAQANLPTATDSQGITLMMLIGGIDRSRCPDRATMSATYAAHRVNHRGLCVFWHPRADWLYVNISEVQDRSGLSARDLTDATIECRRQCWAIYESLRAHVPGFENSYVAQTAPAIGVRETRHLVGLYTLDGHDVATGARFDDVVARCACPVDVHAADARKAAYGWLKQPYDIPYRCLVSPQCANLLVCGRGVSADHVAHSSLRRMGPGLLLGEAAGAAAAMGCRDVRSLDYGTLQEKLRQHGAILE